MEFKPGSCSHGVKAMGKHETETSELYDPTCNRMTCTEKCVPEMADWFVSNDAGITSEHRQLRVPKKHPPRRSRAGG